MLAGNANRDRIVNIADFAIVAARLNQPGGYVDGDFNYDGIVNIGDFSILASNFNKSLPAPRSPVVPVSPVPPPSRGVFSNQRSIESVDAGDPVIPA